MTITDAVTAIELLTSAHPELHTPLMALSLAVLRKRVEERLIGEDLDIKLVLDRDARQERDRSPALSPRQSAPPVR